MNRTNDTNNMTNQVNDLSIAKDVATFKTKNKEIPVGDQNKPFTAKDFSILRKFFKHSDSETIRQWIVSAMYNNKLYTEEQLKKQAAELRDDYIKKMSEQKHQIEQLEKHVYETVEQKQLFRSDLETLAKYCSLPWYVRIFKSPPVL